MAIPASQIVSIVPRVISAGGSDLEINGMILTKSLSIPTASPLLAFTDAASVGSYFGLLSPEYEAASIYFKGYENAFKMPATFYIGRRFDAAAAAWLRGAKYSGTLEALQAITSGGLSLTVDGTKAELTTLDFSAASSFSAVAGVIQTALEAKVSGATVTYSSLYGAFQITSPTAGEASTITYASAPATGTDLSALLSLTQSTGAVISQGTEAMTVTENLETLVNSGSNWATFTTLYDAEAEYLELASWASGKGTDYAYICWTQAATALVASSDADPASKLKEASAGSTAIVYGPADMAVFVMAIAASIDWNRFNGVSSYAFKSQSGLAATVDNGVDASTLLSKGYNFYGNYATRNDDFTFLYNGQMFGQYEYIDTYINAIWLNNAFQLALMDGLKGASIVPYTDEGYGLIRGWLMDPINRAVNNGVITPGITLTEAQRGELIREAGQDISGDIEAEGWYLQVEDPGGPVRAARDTPTVSFWYAYGGSVNKISMSSTVIL